MIYTCVFSFFPELDWSDRPAIQSFLRGGRLLLLRGGVSLDEVEFLETNAHRELDESTIPMLFKIHGVYARKKAAP